MNRLEGAIRDRTREIVVDVARLWWVFVIVAPLFALGLYFAIDHANANTDRQQRQNTRQLEHTFKQAQLASERKFQQALRVAVYSINSNACGFEHYGLDAISRAEKARDDPRSDARVVAAAKATIRQTRGFLQTNAVKVPVDFDCATLPKKPPKGAP